MSKEEIELVWKEVSEQESDPMIILVKVMYRILFQESLEK